MSFRECLRCKVRDVGEVLFTIILASVVFLGIGVFMIVMALTYEKIEPPAQVLVIAFGAFSIVFCLVYAVACPILLLKYPKHKKITHLLLKKELFLPDYVIEKGK